MNLKAKEETSRVGTKWLPEEDTKLVQEMTKNKTYDEIALEHKRSSTGIKSRVISQIIYPIFKEGNKTLDDLSIDYKIDKELLEKYINNIDIKSVDKNSSEGKSNTTKSNNKNKELFEKIISFENKFELLENKLDYVISLLTK
jgi:hypothetical protein